MKRLNGVARCVVGYSGGVQPKPNYGHIMDYTESLLVEFDPTVVTYEGILKEWSGLDYPYVDGKRQYRSAVFYLDDEQGNVARNVVKPIEDKARGREVYIAVEKVTKFYRAEEYHQDFLDKDMLY